MTSCYCSVASFISPTIHPNLRRHNQPPLILPLRRSAPPRAVAVSDPLVLEIAEKLEDSLPPSPLPSLQRLRDVSSQSLLSKPWPTNRDEPFRFTDLSYLKRSSITPSSTPSTIPPNIPSPIPSSTNSITLLDGHVVASPSLSDLPAGAYIGSLSALPSGPTLDRVAEILAAGADAVSANTDLFFDLNGVGAPDVAVVYVPTGAQIIDSPVHLRFCAAEGADVGDEALPFSNPRVLVVVEDGAEVAILEEYLGVDGNEKCYWTNTVMEILIGDGANVSHSYLQNQSRNAAHIKWTFTRQESSSTYKLVEISTGGRLSRHNLHIQQLGPDTFTELAAFHVSQSNQIQDLHSRLILDHPRGFSRQLHKSIISNSSGQAVFDGNIRVNRYAQQTDAGQLTRTLLLAPRATANVKPNLQIVADDVKCSHGAAISDLEEDQLFYFQARGVDLQTARDALVFSFGSEVLSRLPSEALCKIVTNQVKELLSSK